MRSDKRTRSRALTICGSLLSVWLWVSFAEAQQTLIVADDGARASAFRFQPGRVLTFICPSTLKLSQDIWGTDVYLDDSPICTAALHAGVLSRGTSGQVTIVIGTGAEFFASSERNGVTSLKNGPDNVSYSFVPNTQPGQIDWTTTYDMVPDDFHAPITVACPPKGITDSDVWGTDVYSASSAICVAALHAGAITLDGGLVTLTLQPKQQTFVASVRNGVSSRGWSSWEYTFYPQPYTPTPGTIVEPPLAATRSEPGLSSRSLAGGGPRTITVAGFTASGTATPIVPRTITLGGFAAAGTATPIVPRTISLPGWTGVGAPTTR
jgi:hypothetical protein